MALSYVFKQSIRRQTQWQRRATVVWFLAMCLTIILKPIVCGPVTSHRDWIEMMACLALMTTAFDVAAGRPRQRRVYISSLDERAYLRYGVMFNALNPQQQERMLARYRVGTYVWRPATELEPDDAQRSGTGSAWRTRLGAMFAYALVAAVLRWAEMHGHAHFITELWMPVLLAGGLAAWVLPDMVRKWRQPDDPPIRAMHLPEWV